MSHGDTHEYKNVFSYQKFDANGKVYYDWIPSVRLE